MRPIALALALVTLLTRTLPAQRPDSLSEEVRKYVAVDTAVIALTHVLLLDGTGADPKPDQTIVIRNGRIAAVGPAAGVPIPDGVRTMDLSGHTVIPGLIGMHDHLFYTAAGGRAVQMSYTGPRLYLASGVTTIRTAGGPLSLRRDQPAGQHRPWTGPRPPNPPDRALYHRGGRRRKHGRGDDAGRGAPVRGLLGQRGRHLDQGVHRYPPGGAGRRDQGGTPARASR